MKYTKSVDGEMRANLYFGVRLTKEELAELNMQAKALGFKDYRAYVESQLVNLQLRLSDEYSEMQKQEGIDAAWGEHQTSFTVTM